MRILRLNPQGSPGKPDDFRGLRSETFDLIETALADEAGLDHPGAAACDYVRTGEVVGEVACGDAARGHAAMAAVLGGGEDGSPAIDAGSDHILVEPRAYDEFGAGSAGLVGSPCSA